MLLASAKPNVSNIPRTAITIPVALDLIIIYVNLKERKKNRKMTTVQLFLNEKNNPRA